MTPYIEYPQLLGVLLRMLNEGEGSHHVRREVLKVFCSSHSVMLMDSQRDLRLYTNILCDFLRDCDVKTADAGHHWRAGPALAQGEPGRSARRGET